MLLRVEDLGYSLAVMDAWDDILAILFYGSGFLFWPIRRWVRRNRVRGKSLGFVFLAQIVSYLVTACCAAFIRLQHFYGWFFFLIELNIVFTLAALIAWWRDADYERALEVADRTPHPQNVPGPFYVANQCCLRCDVPRSLAPEMFRFTDSGEHCFVYHQPDTPAQLEKMLQVLNTQDLGCIRCRSSDANLLKQLRERRLQHLCDVPNGGAWARFWRTLRKGSG